MNPPPELRSELAYAIIPSKRKNPDVKAIRPPVQLDPLQMGRAARGPGNTSPASVSTPVRSAGYAPQDQNRLPVTIHGHVFTTVGVVCDVVYELQRHSAGLRRLQGSAGQRGQARNPLCEWANPASPGTNAENDPELVPFVTTVKNGRY